MHHDKTCNEVNAHLEQDIFTTEGHEKETLFIFQIFKTLTACFLFLF